jgi:hypothetical protein
MKNLPGDYVEYMCNYGASEGPISIAPGWYALWPIEALEEYNASYQIAESAPSCYAFGSNGGGELLAFNAKGNVVMVPCIGMSDSEAIVMAETWADFELEIRKSQT